MLKYLTVFTGVVLWVCSCKKNDSFPVPATVNIVHAIANGKPIIPVFGSDAIEYFKAAQTVTFGNAAIYSLPGGLRPVYLAKNTDTTNRIYDSEIDVAAGGIYSLFFAGDTSKPEAVFTRDEIPIYSDSTAGVRFINLSPASGPIKINVKGTAISKPDFSDIGYKQISDFKPYLATAAITGNRYIFEIRDQANDSLLVTYTWSYTRFKNNTLVFSGAVNTGKPVALKIFQVKNY
ncbi:hypothetical protein A4H97_24345 [Niastella yeongjuensis]|uniref:DUF4397 domain-containing protein n=1 Tax=Niastella yeongjuensis TaxID=354355 RepID=A0A1V9F3B8_9BACT|nr:DUF4397 domain-containing protein [Niastella yeongjuensis]OQP52831.1 hypothetical protein A4H97_24345 [Niastella yeongjuensis]SEP20721.1 protein of unknown function [Niastella yeongjuensis]